MIVVDFFQLGGNSVTHRAEYPVSVTPAETQFRQRTRGRRKMTARSKKSNKWCCCSIWTVHFFVHENSITASICRSPRRVTRERWGNVAHAVFVVWCWLIFG